MDIFNTIDSDKRDRIINAAIDEFAAYPFEKASTNNIVKNAGISKGLLFHYFTSKQILYEKLIGFVIQTLYHAIMDKINWEETDLFERIKQIAIVKMEVSRLHPRMFDFMFRMLAYKNTRGAEDIIELYRGYGVDFRQVNEDVYKRNVDYSRFRDQTTIPETLNIVRWSLEKFGEEQLLRLGSDAGFDLREAAAGFDHYMAILKKSFYW